jgi:hypothetical protein
MNHPQRSRNRAGKAVSKLDWFNQSSFLRGGNGFEEAATLMGRALAIETTIGVPTIQNRCGVGFQSP